MRAVGRLFSTRSSRSPSPVSGGGGKEEGSEVFPASQLTPSASKLPTPGSPGRLQDPHFECAARCALPVWQKTFQRITGRLLSQPGAGECPTN